MYKQCFHFVKLKKKWRLCFQLNVVNFCPVVSCWLSSIDLTVRSHICYVKNTALFNGRSYILCHAKIDDFQPPLPPVTQSEKSEKKIVCTVLYG